MTTRDPFLDDLRAFVQAEVRKALADLPDDAIMARLRHAPVRTDYRRYREMGKSKIEALLMVAENLVIDLKVYAPPTLRTHGLFADDTTPGKFEQLPAWARQEETGMP